MNTVGAGSHSYDLILISPSFTKASSPNIAAGKVRASSYEFGETEMLNA
jgi:hypothetical protein